MPSGVTNVKDCLAQQIIILARWSMPGPGRCIVGYHTCRARSYRAFSHRGVMSNGGSSPLAGPVGGPGITLTSQAERVR